MKKNIITILAVISMGAISYAQSGHDHKNMDHGKMGSMNKNMAGEMDHKKMGHNAKGVDKTLKGHLIGLTCYLKHSSSGKKHKSCARSCAEKGLPIALKTEDGKIYIVTGKGHDSLIETYKPLNKYLESNVMVKGKVFEKDGSSMIVIEKIKKS